MRIFLCGLVFVCLVANYGCNSVDEAGIVDLEETVKINAIPVVFDTIRITEEFIFTKKMYVYKDNYLVVENKPNSRSVPFIEIYDIQNQQRIKGFIFNGNGPGEMLSTQTHLTKNILMVHDFVKNQYAVVDLDEALLTDKYIPEVKALSVNTAVSYIAWLDKDHMVLGNPYCFEDDNLGIHNDAERLVVVSPTALSEKVELKLYPNIPINVTQGLIAANSSKDRMIYASLDFPVIEVYDKTLKKIKTINGPDDIPRSFRQRGPGLDIGFYNGTPMSYSGFCCNDDYLWLSYVGKFYEKGTLGKLLHKTPSYIFKFDWDGNFVSSLSAGAYASPISLGSDGETLYATTYDSDDLPVPVKLVVK